MAQIFKNKVRKQRFSTKRRGFSGFCDKIQVDIAKIVQKLFKIVFQKLNVNVLKLANQDVTGEE